MRYYSLSTWTGCQTGMKTCDANVVYSASWDSLFSEHVIQSFRDVYRCLNGFTSKFSHHTLSSLCFQHNIYIYGMARQHFVLWYHFIMENLWGKHGSVEALNVFFYRSVLLEVFKRARYLFKPGYKHK